MKNQTIPTSDGLLESILKVNSMNYVLSLHYSYECYICKLQFYTTEREQNVCDKCVKQREDNINDLLD